MRVAGHKLWYLTVAMVMIAAVVQRVGCSVLRMIVVGHTFITGTALRHSHCPYKPKAFYCVFHLTRSDFVTL